MRPTFKPYLKAIVSTEDYTALESLFLTDPVVGDVVERMCQAIVKQIYRKAKEKELARFKHEMTALYGILSEGISNENV